VYDRTLALQAREQELQGIFNQAAVGIAQTHGQTHKIIKANQRFCDLMGYSMAELMAFSLDELTYAEDLAPSQVAMEKLHRREVKEFSLEKRYVTQVGHLLWANTTVSSRQKPMMTQPTILSSSKTLANANRPSKPSEIAKLIIVLCLRPLPLA
ncbi:MAG: PAS domain S-box protein, partial [Leptolyngbyaceae cyanobacterium SM2_3_12]|nr:PAS domain S-box protein [Leptolyngbyaceae cyanobacterium SM2_3_12]